MNKRQGLIVNLYSTKSAHQLKKYGFVHYVSKRMKYAIVYVNADQADAQMEAIKKLNFVRHVDKSPKSEVGTDVMDTLIKYENERKEGQD